MNLIKINRLISETKINEQEKIYLKGINEKIVPTIGRTTIKLIINNNEFKTDFYVVDRQFPVSGDGILGNAFLVANHAVIDIANNILVINDTINEIKENDICFTLQPRTETIVNIEIADKNMNNKNILINKQELSPDVYCANIYNTVRDGKIKISVMNISEVAQSVKVGQIHKISYEHDIDTEINEIANINNNSIDRVNKIKGLIRSDHLNAEERKSIIKICEQYSDIFHLEGDYLTSTTAAEHVIKVPKDLIPIYKKPYRLPYSQHGEIERQIEQMQKDDVIEKSMSPFNAPLLLVKKKADASGKQKFRIVIDFRALNDVTLNEFHPLPNITEILDQLGQCHLFSLLDLRAGYHQVPLAKESRELTAFSTGQGHYHFKRLVMGLSSAPSTFQKMMANVLSGLIGIKCLVYLDDIIVYAKNLSDHNNKLINVFERLRIHNLKIEPDKCEFLKRQVLFLGHIVTEAGLCPDPAKVTAVMSFPVPKNVKQIKSFLGLSGYYRKFINNYSAIANPMTNLLRKDIKFNWDENCQQAFDKLKEILCSEPILQYPDFTKEFILTTDASGKALGAILSQGQIGSDLPVAYSSRTLNRSELNYSTTELECLAIIFGVKTFRPYLYGRKFIILTDHRPLSWLFNLKDPLSKLARWRIELEQYTYEIRYKPGVQNANVDALSRMYSISEIKNESYSNFIEKSETMLITNKNVKEVHGELIDSPVEYNIVSEIEKHYNFRSGINYELKQRFGKDETLESNKDVGDIVRFKHEDRSIIFLITKTRQKQLATYENMHLALLNLKYFCEKHSLTKLAMNQLGREDGLDWARTRSMIRYIFRNTDIEIIICTRLEFSREEKLVIFRQFHDSKIGGHGGVNRTLRKIKRQFNWPNMKKEVKDYIRNCTSCQKNKNTNKHIRSPMVITTTSTKPFEKIFLDIVGPLITTDMGNTYILTIQCDLTKFSLGKALPNHTANTVAEAFVTSFVCIHGIPDTILTD